MSSQNICMLASDHLISSDEESGSEKMLELACQQTSEPLLAVLDDKNKIINNLIRQNENQKMQLSYYLKKEFGSHRIEELSHSCAPQACEISLAVNLALNKFCRQAGLKTKLSRLHERMSQLDYQVASSLGDQEFVLRRIVSNLCEHVRQQIANGEKPIWRYLTASQVDLFEKLLDATLSLRRTLNNFRICCDRLIIVEEERNNVENRVAKMLRKINLEAQVLLDTTESRRRRLELETSKSKLPELERVLFYVRTAVDFETLDEKGLEARGIRTDAEIGLCKAIKEELKKVTCRARLVENEEWQPKVQECESLQAKLRQSMTENEQLRSRVMALECDLEAMKFHRENSLERLREERDVYKSQAEDLRKIREAYAQLVDKQPNASKIEREYLKEVEKRDERICDFEREVCQLRQEANVLRKRMSDQNYQVPSLIDQDRKLYNQPPTEQTETAKPNSSSATPSTDNPAFWPLSENLPTKKVIKGFTKPSRPHATLKTDNAKPTDQHFAPERSKSPTGDFLAECNMYSQQISSKYDLVRGVLSTNKTAVAHVQVKGSSTLRVVCKCGMDESEIFRDCSNESLIIWGTRM
ncbi:protein Daple-like isoform X2 [Cylas formicarius]|uniref:protein Daple-like isoform X2 n=1 Tax=Cylas formicarius TaxID=197179 RepID=UPI002958C346|nr:protein Daple-like isoform X2 [Cylas formicarius]